MAFLAENFICAVAQFSKLQAAYHCRGRLTIHHVREYGSPKNDRETIPLCRDHHLHDFSMFAIERLGKAKFEQYTGLSIAQLVVYYREAYVQNSQGTYRETSNDASGSDPATER